MKLAFVTDLHLGATAADFHQQTYDPDCHEKVVAALRTLIARENIQSLLIGGDMTHSTSPERIAHFVELFKDASPNILMCLGNHDVCMPDTDHMELWWKFLDPHPQFSLAPFSFVDDEVVIHAINTCWADSDGATRLFWKHGTGPQARVSDADLEWLDGQLGYHPDRPAIVLLHGELDPLPPALTGLEAPIHVPAKEYVGALNAVFDRHPQVKLVLAGHNHVTHAVWHGRRVHLTTGSMSEVPFYVRIIEVENGTIRVRTEPLMPTALALDEKKRWSMGRESDRTVVIP